ncbi:SOS response-associated peptidase family protein [Caulobacter hibisci]|uniref:Abasic site processing protein n=1 Tax=Caulobacter hibisci TaxID=2035993 RepID=A0ABS0SX50_9CAUL|nr:SOS response-associated peptidase family protein [Caulobacter hibisci]MBI1684191.1 SOS response-associated peptidase family protein [Caulobacter hibisci]
MCNEYARLIALAKLNAALAAKQLPLFEWAENQIPNDLDGKDSVRISDTAPVFRFDGERLVASMTPWAWKAPNGRPVFNYVTETRPGSSQIRNFTQSDRVLVLATGFYEFTAPTDPKTKLKDKHLFTLKNQDFFWIAGVVKEGAFTLLTTAPGPDLAPYHDRQVVILPPSDGLAWLTLSKPSQTLLRTLPEGSLAVTTLRRDGMDLAA